MSSSFFFVWVGLLQLYHNGHDPCVFGLIVVVCTEEPAADSLEETLEQQTIAETLCASEVRRPEKCLWLKLRKLCEELMKILFSVDNV